MGCLMQKTQILLNPFLSFMIKRSLKTQHFLDLSRPRGEGVDFHIFS